MERLKYVRLKAEVIRTRLPGGEGRSGILLRRVIEKEFEIGLDDDHLVWIYINKLRLYT